MSQPYRVQLGRIVAPEKVSDRFLASGTLRQRDDWAIGEQVVIVYLFEITRPWFASSTVFEAISSTLAQHLQTLKPDDTFADQFEIVLQKVNQALGVVSDQGETDWIGSFNGMIMALGGSELHFAQTGSCPAYLLQNNRIRQITDHDQESGDPHPLKTFVNLASGNIALGDQILIGNHELYRELSLDALRRIINGSSSYQAAATIVRELKRVRNGGVQSTIISIVAPETPEEPADIFLEEEMRTPLQRISRFVKPLIKQAGETAGKMGVAGVSVASQAGSTLSTHVAPKALTALKHGLKEAKQLTQDVASEIKGMTRPGSVPSPEPAADPAVSADASAAVDSQEMAPMTEPPTAPISSVVMRVYPRLPKARVNALAIVLPYLSTAFSAAQAFIKTTKGRKTILAIAAIALIATTTSLALARRSKAPSQATENKNTSILASATTLEAKIRSAVKLDQQIEASRDIETVQQELRQIQNPTDAEREQVTQLWNSITTLSDQLTETTRFSSWDRVVDLGSAGNKLAATTAGARILSEGGRTLLTVGPGESTPVSLTVPGASDSATAITNGGDVPKDTFILTSQNKLYRLAENSGLLVPVSLEAGETFAKGDVLSAYYGNLYVVDTVNGLLWKYAGVDGSYTKGVSVIDKAQYDIKGSISMAIDGSIYLLRKDGMLQKFTRGQQDTSFTLKDQPELSKKLVQPLQVITGEDMNSIYVLDGGLTTEERSTAKILVFNKAGEFTGQYGFPSDFTRVRSFAVDPAARKLWVVNDSSLYEFGM